MQQFIGALCLPLQHRIDHRLNIVERRRWVRPYLRYYLGLVDDDRRVVLLLHPLSHHFTTQEEELLEIGMVMFKHLVTLLRQGVECRLDDVVLIEVGFVDAEVSTIHA
jgi:hypothetical protein